MKNILAFVEAQNKSNPAFNFKLQVSYVRVAADSGEGEEWVWEAECSDVNEVSDHSNMFYGATPEEAIALLDEDYNPNA